MNLVFVLLGLHALLMAIDEYLHHQRGLAKWERWGHPLDTLTVLVPVLYISTQPYSLQRLKLYITFSLFSCLFITKDEWVHAKECGPFESWIHSMLFILHPLIFMTLGLAWREGEMAGLRLVFWVTAFFMLYQILRWSIPWKKTAK